MLQADHVIHIGVARQQLLFDALDRKVHHSGHALHGGGDRQNVAGADRAIRVAVALEGVARERLGVPCRRSCLGQVV